MSVLIECLTLVVQQKELDMRYPGGADAFLHTLLDLDRPPRFITSADPLLAAISFYSPEHMQPCIELLQANGFTDVEDGRVLDFAYVDQRFGPTMPCHWLEWRRHRDGFTYAWLAGMEPGDMAVDEGWTPERSRRQVRHDVRDEPGRMMKLAEDESGVETWLDTSTAMQVVGLPQRDSVAPEPDIVRGKGLGGELDLDAIMRELGLGPGDGIDEPAIGPLLKALHAHVQDAGWEYELDLPKQIVRVPLETPNMRYQTDLWCSEEHGLVGSSTRAAFRVPKESRVVLCEMLNRVNWRLPVGNFEMDMDDGEVVFRIGLDCGGTAPGSDVLERMINLGTDVFEQYGPTLFRVMYDDTPPARALEEMGS